VENPTTLTRCAKLLRNARLRAAQAERRLAKSAAAEQAARAKLKILLDCERRRVKRLERRRRQITDQIK